MECCTKNNNKSSEHTEHEVAHEDNQSKHSHSGCGDHGSSEGWTDSAANFLRRFWIVTVLLIPLVLTNEMTAGLLGIGDVITYAKWIGFITATVIFGFALIFFQHASHEIRSGNYGMMTLVSLAVGSGYLFSVASTFLPALEVEFYLEISTLIWVLLFGHYLEAKTSFKKTRRQGNSRLNLRRRRSHHNPRQSGRTFYCGADKTAHQGRARHKTEITKNR